jgi:hypothetical protein
MTPTPSLPASIREALDAYVAEITRLTRDVSQVDSVQTARAELEASISALVADAPELERERANTAFAVDHILGHA